MKKIIDSRLNTTLFVICLFVIISLLIAGTAYAAGTDPVEVDNGIPVVYLNIDESRGTIRDMINSPDHSVFCYGAVSIDVPEGFHYCDLPGKTCESVEDLSMSIRGRGNSTWMLGDKKPFKIKLDEKADLFGLGENKHWVLVANDFDPSLLRDRITAWLGDEMGFEFTPRGVPVDLVMTGEKYGSKYLGSYYLSENVRVDKNRLEIDELKKGDTDSEIITGGYLLQDALQVDKSSPDVFYTSRGVDWATHTPSFDTSSDGNYNYSLNADPGSTVNEDSYSDPELGDGYKNDKQQKYIQEHIQKVEDALFEGGSGYRDLMDIESAAKYWLVQAFSSNADAYTTSSTYIYKVRDKDGKEGKLYWGPLWDFDYGWDNIPTTEGFILEHEWLFPLFSDKEKGGFVDEVKKQWTEMRPSIVKMIEDGGLIDQYCAETKTSAEQDYLINGKGDPDYSYEENVKTLKDWIRGRLDWVDANISQIDDLVYTVTFISDGEVYDKSFKESGKYVSLDDKQPKKDGYVFIGWEDENGKTIEKEIQVTGDITLTAKFIPDSEATHIQDIALRRDCDIIPRNNYFTSYYTDFEIVPVDAQEREIEWTSSDESYATVDQNGIIKYNGAGTVTVTAKLRNGNTRKFTLTVTDDIIPDAESISPEKDSFEMTVGELTPIMIETDPSPAYIGSLQYVSLDEDVITVDDYGVLNAVAPGETKVRVSTRIDNEELKTFVDVKVSGGSPEPEPAPDPEPTPDPKPTPDPEPTPDVKPDPKPDPAPDVKPDPKPVPDPVPAPVKPVPDTKPDTKPEPSPEHDSSDSVTPTPEPAPAPVPAVPDTVPDTVAPDEGSESADTIEPIPAEDISPYPDTVKTDKTWTLTDLIMLVIAIAGAAVSAAFAFFRKNKGEDDYETGEYDAEIKKPANPLLKSISVTVTIAVAAIAAVVFFLSSDLSGKMRFSGDRTILMVILAAAAAVFTFLTVIKSSTPSADEAYDTDDIDDTDDQE